MSAFELKIIAIIAMFIDHFAYVFDGRIVSALVPVMRMVGRMTFPIFAYFVGEGFRHTRDIRKYLARLGVFALISQVPFTLAFYNARIYPQYEAVWLDFGRQNIFFTLFLGLLAACMYRKLSAKWYYPVLFSQTFIAAMFLQADFGLIGMILVFACAVIERKAYRLAVLLLGGLALHMQLEGVTMLMMNAGYFAAIMLLALYNGKQGPKMKWLFYIFYPLHLLLLFGLMILYETFL